MAENDRQNYSLPSEHRTTIAKWVVGGSVLSLVAVTITFLSIGGDKDSAELAFSMLVPMLGTWIGTVIAYYFSRENFEAASQSMSSIVARVTEQKLRSIMVSDVMIDKISMKKITLEENDDMGEKVNLQRDVIEKFEGPITRMPVLDNAGSARYIIHQSYIYKFVTEKTIEEKQNSGFEVESASLKDFLEYKDMKRIVSDTMAFVSIDGTLADAKKAMEQKSKAQDVFITKNGRSTEPVEGWLTNVDISKHIKI